MEVAACDAFRPEWKRWERSASSARPPSRPTRSPRTRPVEYEVRSPGRRRGHVRRAHLREGRRARCACSSSTSARSASATASATTCATHSYAQHRDHRPVGRHRGRDRRAGAAHHGHLDLAGRLPARVGRRPTTAGDLVLHPAPVRVRRRRRRRAAGPSRCTSASAPATSPRRTAVLLDGDEASWSLLDPDADGGRQRRRPRLLPGGLRRRPARAASPARHWPTLSTVERYSAGRRHLGRRGGRRARGRRLRRAWPRLRRRARAAGVAGRCSTACAGATGSSTATRRERFRAFVRELVAPALDRARLGPGGRGRPHGRAARHARSGPRRARRRPDAPAAGPPPCYERAVADPASVDPELLAAASRVVAATGNVADYERFVDALPARRHPAGPAPLPLRARRLPRRGADASARWSSPSRHDVKTQNAPFLLGRCIANRDHGALAWRLVRERWADANDALPRQHHRPHGRPGEAAHPAGGGGRRGRPSSPSTPSPRRPRRSSRSSSASGSTSRCAARASRRSPRTSTAGSLDVRVPARLRRRADGRSSSTGLASPPVATSVAAGDRRGVGRRRRARRGGDRRPRRPATAPVLLDGAGVATATTLDARPRDRCWPASRRSTTSTSARRPSASCPGALGPRSRPGPPGVCVARPSTRCGLGARPARGQGRPGRPRPHRRSTSCWPSCSRAARPGGC